MGYFRTRAFSPLTEVADIKHNTTIITDALKEAAESGVEMLVTPELCVTGYTCADLFENRLLIDAAKKALVEIADKSHEYPHTLLFVGVPLLYRGALYNCAAAICGGKILAVVPKTFLPNYNEFYEKRWFASASSLPQDTTIKLQGKEIPFGNDILIRHHGVFVGAEICEDLWTAVPPSSRATVAGAQVIANLSASNEVIGKHEYLMRLISQQSARCRCAYVYASAGCGESTQDLVYSGNAIIAENGRILAESPRFACSALSETRDIDIQLIDHDRSAGGCLADAFAWEGKPRFRTVETSQPDCICDCSDTSTPLRETDPYPFVPRDDTKRAERCAEITAIQTEGLMRRLRATGCQSAVIGISGGLDSTLALLVTANAFDRLGLPRKGITGITMPGFGTTRRTHSNADTLMRTLGITVREIDIDKAVRLHFADIGHDEKSHDVVYENSQARERTQILMDVANQTGGMVIGTGDLSELALGWATYNGDHMSMYGVNVSIPKTLVRYLVRHYAEAAANKELRDTLLDIIDTPISPELTPADAEGNIAQKTEDLVGPYPLHDFFLYNMLRHGFGPIKIYRLACDAFHGEFDRETVAKWLKVFIRRFFSQQFKRSCLPDGPKVGSICLSPRGDWRMPSDVTSRTWLAQLEKL